MSDIHRLLGLPDGIKRTILSFVDEGRSNAPQAPEICLDDVSSVGAGLSVCDNFLPQDLLEDARVQAAKALEEGGRAAGMGGADTPDKRWQDNKYRGDSIMWLHEEREVAAGRMALVEAVRKLKELQPQLAAMGHDVGGKVTFQLGCYPGGGSRYVRHSDASPSCPTRSITAICYINPGWNPQRGGGHLAVYNVRCRGGLCGVGYEGGEAATLVAPLGGRLVVMASSMEHEVLPCHETRYAVTAWFHCTPAAATPGVSEPHTSTTGTPTGGLIKEVPFHTATPPKAPAPNAPHTDQPLTQEHPLLGQLPGSFPHTPGRPSPHPIPVTDVSGVGPSPHSIPVADVGLDEPFVPTGQQQVEHSTPTHKLEDVEPPTPTGRQSIPNDDRIGWIATQPEASCSSRLSEDLVFVSIAAYRDEECQWTLQNLFTQAAHPERLRVCVVWQVDPVLDAAFVRIPGASNPRSMIQKHLHQVREIRVHWREAEGPCWARWAAQQMWRGEEYFLQIDSHMRFEHHWDDLLLRELKAAEAIATHARVVLSTYPLEYHGTGPAAAIPSNAPATLLCAKAFDQDGLLRIEGRSLKRPLHDPLPSSFWAAGYSFSRSNFLVDVPYCPHLPYLFFGEELYMLARMWTHGYDLFSPSRPLIFHQWERSARANTAQRDGTWDMSARRLSQQRILRVIHPSQNPGGTGTEGTCPDGAAAWLPGGKWGVGTRRTLQDFWEHIGVDFGTREISSRAQWGGRTCEDFLL